jgi:hypothetical protein
MTGRPQQRAQISLTSYGGPNGPPPTRALPPRGISFLVVTFNDPGNSAGANR